ncbi:hypothetical protein EM858_14335 [Agrobacterium sp. CNPSo 2736]|uniref:hypothetical protein n=1 Tax=Agrobacterium sp. CNPSo 2736 TaxID=2499627 RepID=UPI000FD6F99F|nr:hypothetical protein [Agrobacterium sp. CNPSo 2736]RVT75624.1 hypothetical protein EM858_14335 [Agrobacterium sp. CNPSo 2736]
MSVPFRTPEKQVHPEFARRLLQASDSNYQVPAPNEGRLRWFVEQLEQRGHKVSMETVRKWLSGLTVPRQKMFVPLAEILKVDAGWLAAGTPGKPAGAQQRANVLSEQGAANVVAGFIQMDGGQAAFPSPDDKDARDKSIDMHAIIRGAKYDITVTTLVQGRFKIPVTAAENIILAVAREPAPGFGVKILEIEWEEATKLGKMENGAVILDDDLSVWREVKSFSERL